MNMTPVSMTHMVTLLLSLSACLCEDTCERERSASTTGVYSAASASCSRAHITSALAEDVSCAPVPVVVSLPWPNVTGVQQMTPTHVAVTRCHHIITSSHGRLT